MEIRKLVARDYKPYVSLRVEALETYPLFFGSTNIEEQVIRESRYRETMVDSDNFILGAFHENQLIGMTGFVRSKALKIKHNGVIWGMYVKSMHMGKGIGKQLLSTALTTAFQLDGLLNIKLGVVTFNQPALKLYEKLGFTVFGEEKSALCYQGNYCDEYLMVINKENWKYT